MNFLSTLAASILAPLVLLTGWAGNFLHTTPAAPPAAEQTLGSGIANSFVGGKAYFLGGSGISSTATTISLTSLTLPVTGTTITISNFAGGVGYGTLEPGSSLKQEFVSFTGITQNANGSATLTGVTRGLLPVSPYTASASYAQSHSGGSVFILSDAPGVYQKIIDYVDATAFAGAPDASTVLKGVGELATGAEAAASTATGGSGPLVLPASLATSTYNSATAANRVVVTGGGGKIDGGFLDLTSGTFTFGTSSLNVGAFPAWQIGKQAQYFTSTGTTTFSVPSGITKVSVEVVGGGGAGAGVNGTGSLGGGGGGGFSFENVDVTGTSTIQVYVGAGGAGTSGTGTRGEWSTFGTNGFYLSATGGLAAISNAGGTGGIGSGGDFNAQGGGGGGGGANATNPSGAGGSSRYGGGGASLGLSNGTGNAGGIYGGGGGGGSSNTFANGGSGGQGIVIVRW